MNSCIIFGGAGYIGTKLTWWLLEKQKFDIIHIVDIKDSSLAGERIIFHKADVRLPIEINILKNSIKWIFNLAAIHREPGHESHEYFETNIKGAQNICEFAIKTNCQNIFFTSSISVYGPRFDATVEETLTMPNTPYGVSKLTAEYINRIWASEFVNRRLVIVRPGVIYGPGDPGNILRMIKAIKKGHFFLPTSPSIKKSYGYIYGLIESVDFMMCQFDKVIIYNYVEKHTETIGEMIKIVNKKLGLNRKVIRLPFGLLKAMATIVHFVIPRNNAIHPERVKKVARPTHIIPSELIKRNFSFTYDFGKSLQHWETESGEDFE